MRNTCRHPRELRSKVHEKQNKKKEENIIFWIQEVSIAIKNHLILKMKETRVFEDHCHSLNLKKNIDTFFFGHGDTLEQHL